MFQLQTLIARQSIRSTQRVSVVSVQSQSFNSIFGGIFGKKKKEEDEVAAPKKPVAAEPAGYHKESVKEAEKQEENIKDQVRNLDRSGPNNLFGKYQRQRKTLKERNSNLAETHLHAELQTNSRVSIFKYESNIFKRGLQENETPFPVSPKVGPYLVEKPIFGAKNYYYCQCGLSQSQPFCDSSHNGTLFKPLKFSLDEKSERLHLCGCKLTSQAPFCDGQTCKKIIAGESFEEAQKQLEENQQAAQVAAESAPSKQ